MNYFEERNIKIGDSVILHFAGGPNDMPLPWIVIKLEYKHSTVNYKLNPSITVRASNGIERTFDFANIYCPEHAN